MQLSLPAAPGLTLRGVAGQALYLLLDQQATGRSEGGEASAEAGQKLAVRPGLKLSPGASHLLPRQGTEWSGLRGPISHFICDPAPGPCPAMQLISLIPVLGTPQPQDPGGREMTEMTLLP